MTKQEAIWILDKLHNKALWDEDSMDLSHALALNMAISALSNSQKQTDSLIRTSTDSVSEADVIYRADAIDAIDEIDWYHQNRCKDMVSGANSDEHQAWYKADDVYKALESVPSAQPEIIRCKDCSNYGTQWCMGHTSFYGLKDDDFCSHAERKDNG